MLGRCFAGSGLLTVVLLFGFCIFSMCSGWTLINGAASLYLCIFYTSLITFLICGGLWLPKNCEHPALSLTLFGIGMALFFCFLVLPSLSSISHMQSLRQAESEGHTYLIELTNSFDPNDPGSSVYLYEVMSDSLVATTPTYTMSFDSYEAWMDTAVLRT